MLFEYESKKSEQNRQKHGVDFEEAQQIWLSDPAIVPARYVEESRWVAIGKINSRLYTAVFTEREDRIRIISCRPANKKEKEAYNG